MVFYIRVNIAEDFILSRKESASLFVEFIMLNMTFIPISLLRPGMILKTCAY